MQICFVLYTNEFTRQALLLQVNSMVYSIRALLRAVHLIRQFHTKIVEDCLQVEGANFSGDPFLFVKLTNLAIDYDYRVFPEATSASSRRVCRPSNYEPSVLAEQRNRRRSN